MANNARLVRYLNYVEGLAYLYPNGAPKAARDVANKLYIDLFAGASAEDLNNREIDSKE